MKQTVTFLVLLFTSLLHAQAVLFVEDLEGPAPAIEMNSADMGGVTNGVNLWVKNNAYAGGSGELNCSGFQIPFTIPTTAAQPAGIPNANGQYLHITSEAGMANGIENCSFAAADGFCVNAASHFARMTTDVNTVGASTITFAFWWLCGGSANNYGEVYYSTNSGSTWQLVTSPIAQYSGQVSWVQQSMSIPEFAGQNTLRFGFRFVNNTTSTAQDPGFGVDNLVITSATSTNSISTQNITPTGYCQGSSITVPYTASGAYTAGNTFTAQLSDASGSFVTPVILGSVTSTTSGSISGTIPAATAAGTGYLVRVVSSTPVVMGTPYAMPLSVTVAPNAGTGGAITLCKNTGIYDLTQHLSGSPAACGTWSGPMGAISTGQFNSGTDIAGNYLYITNCPGACAQDTATLMITLQNPANAGNDVTTQLCSDNPPSTLLGYVAGGDLTGFFFYPGSFPDFTIPGSYAMDYVVYANAPCVNDTSAHVFVVNPAPNAGTGGSFSFNVNDPSIDLFSLLIDNPDQNGIWTGPNGQAITPPIDPTSAASGLYTYTVNGIAPCQDDDASIALVIAVGIDDIQADLTSVVWAGQQGASHTLIVNATHSFNLDVIDAMGRLIHVQNSIAARERINIDLNGNATGTYTVRLSDGQQAQAVRLWHAAQ